MANHDIEKIRGAIAEEHGRAVRVIRRNKSHRPHLRPAPQTPGEFVLALLSIVLTFLALLFAISAAQLAAFWIGDHAQHHGKAWPVFRALGYRPWDLGGEAYLFHAVFEEFRLLPWIMIVAVGTAALARPYQAVLVAFAAGIVENNWWLHLPTYDFPKWFADLVDKQRTLLEHFNPWQAFGILLGLAFVGMAWAERTQAP
ncbi:hypothetical protein [Catenulispora subtropica]|uniref:Uncharacterized protein n=1 Tax=Catenulispora subtropica TaxID=450798 RepID=A0ABN2QYQ8_9ACTN